MRQNVKNAMNGGRVMATTAASGGAVNLKFTAREGILELEKKKLNGLLHV